MEKVNKHIQRTLGGILQREADLPGDTFVTISHVDTARNLQSSTVWLYISPSEMEGEVLNLLKPQMYDIQGSLNRRLRMHPLPRITFRADHGQINAQHVNDALHELNR